MHDHDADLPVDTHVAGSEDHDTHGEAPPLTPTPEELGIELPDDPEAARNELLGLLAEARHDVATERDHALRAVAELDNVRKRSLREAAEVRSRATEGLVTQLLTVLDSFDAGLNVEPRSDEAASLRSGFAGVRAQLMGVLQASGLEPIPAVGETFDPTVHEAVSMLGDGDTVVAEMRPGYSLAGKVIRPASVVVGSPDDGGGPEDG